MKWRFGVEVNSEGRASCKRTPKEPSVTLDQIDTSLHLLSSRELRPLGRLVPALVMALAGCNSGMPTMDAGPVSTGTATASGTIHGTTFVAADAFSQSHVPPGGNGILITA